MSHSRNMFEHACKRLEWTAVWHPRRKQWDCTHASRPGQTVTVCFRQWAVLVTAEDVYSHFKWMADQVGGVTIEPEVALGRSQP